MTCQEVTQILFICQEYKGGSVHCSVQAAGGLRGSQPEENSKMTKEECVGFFPCTWELLTGCNMPDGKLQCGVDRCVQRVQIDCLHIQVLSFYSQSSLYDIKDQSSHLISAAKSWWHKKKAIIGFRHAGDLLGKIMVCGERYHMKTQVSNHDKLLEISFK